MGVFELNFEFFDMIFFAGDTLHIYADTGSGFELYDSFSRTLSPFSILIPARRLKFIWKTDFQFQDQGFNISWECFEAMEPVSAFELVDFNPCFEHVRLEDRSTQLPNSWQWFLDDQIIGTTPGLLLSVQPGIYDVTLIVCNDLGCDTSTVENLIHYDPAFLVCDAIVMSEEQLELSTACEGVIVDDGGPLNNYSNHGYSSIPIAAPNAHAYQIKFNFFETENIFDLLTIYVDNGFGFEPVESYAGTHTGLELFVIGTRILFEWDADNSGTRPGFEVEWACVIEPVIDPIIERSDCENGFDFSLNSPNTNAITWIFGDGEWGVGSTINHRYETPGSYQVTGSASNEFGDTTFIMFVEAVYHLAYFEAPNNIPLNEVQTIQILEPAQDQIQSIRWTLDGNYLNNTNTLGLLIDQNGSYELGLEITDLFGCVSTYTQTIIAGVVNTQTLTDLNIRIQPNPTKDLLHLLDLQTLDPGYSLNLMNTTGQQVYQYTPAAGTERLTIDMRALPPGIYYLNIAYPTMQYKGKRIIKIE